MSDPLMTLDVVTDGRRYYIQNSFMKTLCPDRDGKPKSFRTAYFARRSANRRMRSLKKVLGQLESRRTS